MLAIRFIWQLLAIRDYNFENIRKNNKRIILVNNGIHPGEPDGIDASMLLARDIITGKYKIADNVVLAFIPVYNIGGCLNRSANFRVDQNGPEEFGEMPEIEQAWNITGEESWLLRISVVDVEHLDRVVSRLCLLAETSTSIVLKTLRAHQVLLPPA